MFKYVYFGKDIPPLSTYNLLIGIGIIAFFLSLERVIRKNAIQDREGEKIKSITFLAAMFGVLGAALVESVNHRTNASIEFSGFTFYGGLVISLLILWIAAWTKAVNYIFVGNTLVIPLVLAHAFGRIGCFLGGCCYGLPTASIFGVVFPEGSLPFLKYGSQPLHPTQLYESIFLFLLWLFLLKQNIKWRFASYLMIYPIFRFAIEWLRGDNRGVLIFDWLSPSQEISIILLFVGCVIYYKSRVRLHFDVS